MGCRQPFSVAVSWTRLVVSEPSGDAMPTIGSVATASDDCIGQNVVTNATNERLKLFFGLSNDAVPLDLIHC